MSGLKLGKLPNRTPVKIAITVSPDLDQALRDYAAIYRATYEEAESVADLIPFMLTSFLDSDRSFARARKLAPMEAAGTAQHRTARPSPPQSKSTTSQED